MPISIVGSKSLALLYWGSRRFSNKGREKTNTCLCCFLPPRWNTLRFTQATVKTTITHNNFRHYRVSFSLFVRQPFSKQLYNFMQGMFPSCREVPRRLKDKLVSYILVLALMIDEFLLDCTVIMRDLKLPMPRYGKIICFTSWLESHLYFIANYTSYKY